MGIRTRETTEYFPKVKNCEQTSREVTTNNTSNIETTNSSTATSIVPTAIAVEKTVSATVELKLEIPNQKEIVVPTKEQQQSLVKDQNSSTEKSENKGNKLKNGIIKANKKMKKGMRIMMERTNKILERSRNCKKNTIKPIVKPRILPARASARLCVRKNSGERELHGRKYYEPLRTVELIKRPLKLRDPATKLLYMASLGLYPKSDPESDTTPIVIINEEVFSPGGKKAKLRSMELPLMPNWRNMYSPPTQRATYIEEDSMLLKIAPISSPLDKSNDKPVSKPKGTKQKSPTPPLIANSNPSIQEEISKTNVNNENERKPNNRKSVKSAVPKKPRQPASKAKKSSKNAVAPTEKEVSPQQPQSAVVNGTPLSLTTHVNEVTSITLPSNQPLKMSVSKDLPFALNSSVTISNASFVPMSNSFFTSISNAPFTSISYTTATSTNPEPGTTIVTNASNVPPASKIPVINTAAPLAPHNMLPESKGLIMPATNITDKKVAGVKRKRKSLETIIKEIPKPKANDIMMTTSMNDIFNTDPTTKTTIGSQSSNPILEGLMKKPVKKRAPKKQLISEQFEACNTNTPTNSQNPISMTVPLQPAPGLPNPNQNGGLLLLKETAAKKPRSKKPKEMFQLPMPMPIPLPPGLLNFASLLPKPDIAPKPKRQRKPKVKKPLETSNVPQPILPRPTIQQSNPQIPYLPSHLEAFFKPLINLSSPESEPPSDEALDLCVVKARPSEQRKTKKPKKDNSSSKSLLKPFSIEEDTPLNLSVVNRPEPKLPSANNKSENLKNSEGSPEPESLTAKPQGNLDNVKQMLARLHTRIAPAVNGVQLITIE